MKKVCLILLALAVTSTISHSADLSFLLLPSEDEIIISFENGEISYDQMVVLLEVKELGLDSSNVHLLDEIPNLLFFNNEDSAKNSKLITEQTNSFKVVDLINPRANHITGTVSIKYYQYIEDNPDTKYQNSYHLKYNNSLISDFKIRREFTGRERVTYRMIKYINGDKVVKEATFGNFTTRFGLGMVFGHRGKLVSFSPKLNSESFLFPDYGGYNGFLVESGFNKLKLKTLLSINRDYRYNLISYGMMLSKSNKSFQPALIIGFNQIKNRLNENKKTDVKIGINYHYNYRNGYNSSEIVYQNGIRNSLAGYVVEGKHRFKEAELKYAGWIYSDDMIDLSSGSKTASISNRDTLEHIDFIYSGKRAGQKGLLLRTTVAINNNTKLSNSLFYAGINHNNLNAQFSTYLTRQISDDMFLSLSFLNKHKARKSTTNDYEKNNRQSRIEIRYKTNRLYFKNYIGYNTSTGYKDYLSLFSNLRYDDNIKGMLEIWLNIAKIDLTNQQLDYWYGFIRHQFKLANNLKTSVKLSHRYNRTSGVKDRTQISFELNLLI